MPLATPRNVVIVIVLAAALYVVGNGGVSLWDRDEPRYAQTSRQMLQGGDWVVPRFLDKVRTAKPVFIYWCQAAAMGVLGDQGNRGVFAARLPSAVAMTIVLIILALFLWKHAGPQHTFWTIFILSSSVLVIWSAKACTTDAVLLVGITVAQLCLYAMWRGHASWQVVIVLALAIAQSGLTKGPVVLGVMGMTLAALGVFRLIDRRLASPCPGTPGEGRGEGQNLASKISDPHPNPLAGSRQFRSLLPEYRAREHPGTLVAKVVVAFLIVTALIGPWLYFVQQRESRFLGTSVSHDVLRRIAQPLEGHSGPPGYHLALIFATFFPWSLLLPMAIVFGWKNRANPQMRFALAAVLGPWIMFELVRTKLPHYMLPTFPALAFLTADAIVRCLRGANDDLRRRGFVIGAGVIALVTVVIGVGAVVLARRFGESLLPAAVLAGAAIVFAASVLYFCASGKPQTGLLALGIGMALIYLALFGVYLPRADFLRLSPRVAQILHGEQATGEGQSVMLDYKEPSLAFYQGGTIRESSAMALSNELIDRAPAWLVITDEVWKKTPQDVRERVAVVGSARGLAYADGGRVVNVLVLRKLESPILISNPRIKSRHDPHRWPNTG
jgi:4-amino-4-deoxy-L-arabinose transferase-like glycosyltransferase